MVVEKDDLPVRVTEIEVRGLKRTDPSFIHGILNQCRNIDSLSQLKEVLSRQLETISRLSLFKDVRVLVDGAKGVGSSPEDVRLQVEVEERRYSLKAGTELRQGEAAFSIGGAAYNVGGRGEMIDAHCSMGTESASPLLITISKPVGKDAACLAQAGLASTLHHYLNGAPYRHRTDGLWLGVQWPRLYSSLISSQANLSYECRLSHELRQLWAVRSGTSPLIRAQAGSGLKTSLSHTLRLSHLDDDLLPTSGYALRLHQEVAHLDAIALGSKHLRTELHGQLHLPLYRKLSLSFAGRLGCLFEPNPSTPSPSFVDRFKMGGPNSVRGFPLYSLGPQQGGDPVGAQYLAEGGIHLTAPLSPATAPFLRAHLWLNGGMLTNQLALGKVDLSAGFGLAVKLGQAARLELNLWHPLAEPFSLRSMLSRGVQLGIGMEFI